MSSRSYNHYDPNVQPDSSMSGPHSQGSKGSYSHPGYLPSPTHGSQSGPPPPYTPQNTVSHQVVIPRQGLSPSTTHNLYTTTYSPSQSGLLSPGDGTGRGYPHKYTPQNTFSHQGVIPRQDLSPPISYGNTTTRGPSQSGPFLPDDGTGRGYPPGYTPQNTISQQVVNPRQGRSPSSSYNLYTTTHGPSQSGLLPPDDGTGRDNPPLGYLPSPAHGISQSGPFPPPNPGPLKQRATATIVDQSVSPGGGTRQRSGMLSTIHYVNEFFL